MSPNEYQREALRTEQPSSVIHRDQFILVGRGCAKTLMIENAVEQEIQRNRLINGLMGLNGEAGEAIDILKKHVFQGHELDREHLAKELGDVAWYLAVSCDALGYSLEEVLNMNVEKLRARYPVTFDTEKSVNRAVGDE